MREEYQTTEIYYHLENEMSSRHSDTMKNWTMKFGRVWITVL